MRNRIVRAVVLVAFGIGAVGCSGGDAAGDSGAGRRAVVKGAVLVRGKPARGGTLRFKVPGGPAGVLLATAAVEPGGSFAAEGVSGPCEVSFQGRSAGSGKAGLSQTVFLEPGDNVVVIQY